MLKIRLQRSGRIHEPTFRLVLTDSKNSTKSGRSLEVLGSHDFRKENTAIDADRVKYWISKGAKPSDTVHNLLLSQKIIEGKKINVLPKKTVPKKEEPAPAAAEASQETPVAEAPVAEVKEQKTEETTPVEAPAAEASESAPEAPKEGAPAA